MPAMNCASPPNIAANGASASGDCGVPHQPARFEATMNVAAANPASPRIDGAAIGCRNTRVPNPFDASLTPVKAVVRRSSSVLMWPPFQRTTMYLRSSQDAGHQNISGYDASTLPRAPRLVHPAPGKERTTMYLPSHYVYVALGIAYLMMLAGVRSRLLEWKR